jgi:hypothetical protein
MLVSGLDDRDSIPEKDKDGIFYRRHRVQTSSGTHPASDSTDTGGCYAGSKAAGA